MSYPSDYRTALDLAAMAVHWIASFWEPSSPNVGWHLRKLADRMAAKAARLKEQEMGRRPSPTVVVDPAVGVLTERDETDDDPFEDGIHDTPTETMTRPYGLFDEDDSDEKT